MSDTILSNGNYQAIVETLRDRDAMLSSGSLLPADQRDTRGLINVLNPTVNPSGRNVALIRSLDARLEK